MRVFRRIALALAVVACGCLRPPQEEVESPIALPERWTAVQARPGGVPDRWWEDFGQPELDELVGLALDESYDLEAVVARVDASRAEARIAGAAYKPQVEAAGSQSREKRNFIGFPIPGRPDSDQPATTTFSIFEARIEIRWEVDLWGRLRAGERAALADVEVARAELRGVEVSLAAQVARAWFTAVAARSQLALAIETARTFRETERGVRRRYMAGLRPSLDLRLAAADTAGAEALVARRTTELESARRRLEVLVAQYPEGRLEVVEELPEVPPPAPAGLPAEILSRRPDLVAAEQRMRAASERIVEARAALYPELSLTASSGFVADSLDDVLHGNFPVRLLLGRLVQPIFQGGRLRAQIDLANAREREAAANFANQLLLALGDVEVALVSERFLAERAKFLAVASEQAASAQEIARQRYATGLVDIITLLTAQRQALDARGAEIDVHLERLRTRVDLYVALGGGFPAGAPKAPAAGRSP